MIQCAITFRCRLSTRARILSRIWAIYRLLWHARNPAAIVTHLERKKTQMANHYHTQFQPANSKQHHHRKMVQFNDEINHDN